MCAKIAQGCAQLAIVSNRRPFSNQAFDPFRNFLHRLCLANVPLQPRRLMIAPDAVGCKRMLGRPSKRFRKLAALLNTVAISTKLPRSCRQSLSWSRSPKCSQFTRDLSMLTQRLSSSVEMRLHGTLRHVEHGGNVHDRHFSQVVRDEHGSNRFSQALERAPYAVGALRSRSPPATGRTRCTPGNRSCTRARPR